MRSFGSQASEKEKCITQEETPGCSAEQHPVGGRALGRQLGLCFLQALH